MFVAICILYTCFRGSPAGEADKIGFFSYVRRFSVGADVVGWICYVSVMFVEESMNISPTWH
jgi:hypothetical protein